MNKGELHEKETIYLTRMNKGKERNESLKDKQIKEDGIEHRRSEGN